MKKTSLAFILTLAAFSAIAQVGIIGGYKSLRPAGWEYGTQFADNYSIGVDYWFRLKKRRIEFTPELSYDKNDGPNRSGGGFYRSFNFHFNTNFYVFNLEEDCDCPVWSKDGNFFTKGFFVQVSPGLKRLKYEWVSTKGDSGEHSFTALGLSLGAGLDVGVSDFITLTPFARYFIYQKSKGTLPAL